MLRPRFELGSQPRKGRILSVFEIDRTRLTEHTEIRPTIIFKVNYLYYKFCVRVTWR